MRISIEERLRVKVEPVDPRNVAALRDRITASPELLDALAPLVGILVYIAPIVAFALLLAVLIMSFVRRARANRGG